MFATNYCACVGMFVLVLMGWSVPLGPGFVPLSSFSPTRVNGSTGLDGVHGSITALDLERASQAA